MNAVLKHLAGKLIVLEGSDEVGKTSISTALSTRFAGYGLRTICLAFPGKTPRTLGNLVYHIHHNSAAEKIDCPSAAALQALHVAAHLDAIERDILPRLADGATIILDRFWWSTWVYGLRSSASPRILAKLIDAEKEAWGETLPKAIFLIERESDSAGPVTDGYREAYRTLAMSEMSVQPVFTISNNTTIDVALDQIVNALA